MNRTITKRFITLLLGLEDNTLVVFTSDNGATQQSTQEPLRGSKGGYYEGGIREPMIVRWPGVVKPGTKCDVPVINVDLFPTFLAAAGAKTDKTLDGESLLPLFKQEGPLTLPDTRIYCIGVPPVRRASTTPEGFNTIRALNALMAELARTEKNVEFIDLFPAFLDAKGQHRAELFVEDGTHFNAKGYQTLTDLLRGKF